MSLRRVRSPIQAFVLGMGVVIGLLGGPALAASHEGSLFDGKQDAGARVYERNERALERFWNDVEEILGSRVGHASEYDHDITSVDIEVGAVALSDREANRLEALAPPFVNLETFPTRYSFDDLEELGARAETALRAARLDALFAGFSYMSEPDEITIHLAHEHPWARKVLRSELPDEAFAIDVQGPVEVWPPDPAGSPIGRHRWVAALASILSLALAVAGVVRLRRSRETTGRPKPAH